MNADFEGAVHQFFAGPPSECGQITNECSLQLELGYSLRKSGWLVRFEMPMRASRLEGSTLKAKYNLDLLASRGGETVGLEIKVPRHGQHPETMYAICADLEFIEALKRSGQVDFGYSLIATDDAVFWTDSGRGSLIHNQFRSAAGRLTGLISKPTGARDTAIVLQGSYSVGSAWRSMSSNLLPAGRYALVPAD